jgi:hypothetical protein
MRERPPMNLLLAVDLELLECVPSWLHEFRRGVGYRGVIEA